MVNHTLVRTCQFLAVNLFQLFRILSFSSQVIHLGESILEEGAREYEIKNWHVYKNVVEKDKLGPT